MIDFKTVQDKFKELVGVGLHPSWIILDWENMHITPYNGGAGVIFDPEDPRDFLFENIGPITYTYVNFAGLTNFMEWLADNKVDLTEIAEKR